MYGLQVCAAAGAAAQQVTLRGRHVGKVELVFQAPSFGRAAGGAEDFAAAGLAGVDSGGVNPESGPNCDGLHCKAALGAAARGARKLDGGGVATIPAAKGE